MSPGYRLTVVPSTRRSLYFDPVKVGECHYSFGLTVKPIPRGVMGSPHVHPPKRTLLQSE